jgi:hypothetical protein
VLYRHICLELWPTISWDTDLGRGQPRYPGLNRNQYFGLGIQQEYSRVRSLSCCGFRELCMKLPGIEVSESKSVAVSKSVSASRSASKSVSAPTSAGT